MDDKTEEITPSEEPEEAGNPSFTISDKRHAAFRETAEGEGPPSEKPRLPSYLEQLQAQLEEKDRKLKQFMDRVDRENADFRERLNREFDRRMEKARADLILTFLPVLDNLERAIAAAEEHGPDDNLLEGMNIIHAQFLAQLKKEGVEGVQVVGEPFDPSMSEAVGVVPTQDPSKDNTVFDELEKGYTINGKLLRPARVRVLRTTYREGE